jgi:hypothetical protein
MDSSPNTGFYGKGPLHLTDEYSIPSDSLGLLRGKLKYLFPTIFSYLSLWERDALNSFEWLKFTTSNVEMEHLVDMGGSTPTSEIT